MASSTPSRTGGKVHENLLRRRAARRGYTLRKTRRRDRHAVDYGIWEAIPEGSISAQRIGDITDVEAWLDGEPYGAHRPGSPLHTDTRLIGALVRSGLAHDARDVATMAGVRPDVAIRKLRRLAEDEAAPILRRPDLGADVFEYVEGQ